MKIKLVLLLFLLNYFAANCQNNNAFIQFPNVPVLYEGFGNVVDVGFKNKIIKSATLVCIGCDTLIVNPDNYVIQKKTEGLITLQVINKKGKVLTSNELKVIKLPKPLFMMDNFSHLDTLDKIPQEILGVKNTDNLFYSSGTLVRSWTVRMDSKIFTGNSSKLSAELKAYLQTKKEGIFVLEVNYQNASGQSSTTAVFWINID